MWSHLLTLACALLLLPAQALAGAKEKVAGLAPSGLVLVMDEKGNELVAQNADQPFVSARKRQRELTGHVVHHPNAHHAAGVVNDNKFSEDELLAVRCPSFHRTARAIIRSAR
jgi:hypothetical protein